MEQPENRDRVEADNASGDIHQEGTPYIAKVVQDVDEDQAVGESTESVAGEALRVGSPFRQGTARAMVGSVQVKPIEAAYAEFGPYRYTSMGASSAAVMLLCFAAAGSIWYPIGGAIVAAQGTILAIAGLFATKRFRIAAIVALSAHIGLFLFICIRSLG